ncbi:ABC transporter ATP-binding protein [Arthrobacter sp. NEB 688]|uniref:ABC transporter ATP-binding protein n=1 Tax=Arthrobacter sp. NEB 688 TaxID=904039 RepID=UPI001567654B|nr:ABC transporter ATP-binding protein [Arthrobacter sp. NEB 688]QKE85322.1 ABC transporter ATP-binding protein [Arthrobacter sp. NEB 688]
MDAITLRAVTKHFGEVRAVDGIDLTIGQGEVVALLGPNGAGKSTTIDLVLGLGTPTDGDVAVFGMHPREAVDRGLVSAVLQSGGLLKDLTVRESVEYTAALFPASRPVDEALEAAGVTAIAGRRIKDCSGGEQQRTRFAMALVPDPELVVLDEPTTGMDVSARRAFWQAIHADAAQGRTVVFATHYLEEAEAWADRVVVVRGGRVVADGTPAELGAMSAGRVVRATLPGPDAEALRALPGVLEVEVRGSAVSLVSTDSDALARHLLTTTAAHDLEIAGRRLEDTFVALTSEDSTAPTTEGLPR